MNPWPYYPPDYGDPSLLANEQYRLWLAQNRPPLASSLTGLGERAITPYPWSVTAADAPTTDAKLRAERRTEAIEKLSIAVGLIGGILGVVLSWKALRGRRS